MPTPSCVRGSPTPAPGCRRWSRGGRSAGGDVPWRRPDTGGAGYLDKLWLYGYRQFAHRGYSVYGYALRLGFIHYLLQQGYTVLDFDYRGSAGFGRDYRTDIAESMGISDTDGAVAAARWLVETQDVDAGRIGIYGVS